MSYDQEEVRKKINELMRDNPKFQPEDIGREMFKILNRTEKKVEVTAVKCEHYVRGCNILAECCKKFYPCRLCHNEHEDHKIDRFATKQIQCRSCGTVQPVSNFCVNCEDRFGEYFCEKCKLWSAEKADIFHCEKCGLCRVGNRDNITHCDKCGFCLPNDIYKDHVCYENGSQMICSICGEKTFDSVKLIGLLGCGHPYHMDCLREYCKFDYRCPICRKSIGSMKHAWDELDEDIKRQPMPAEFEKMKCQIFCNDCSKVSIAPFHFVGLKCLHCASYNTVKIDEIDEGKT